MQNSVHLTASVSLSIRNASASSRKAKEGYRGGCRALICSSSHRRFDRTNLISPHAREREQRRCVRASGVDTYEKLGASDINLPRLTRVNQRPGLLPNASCERDCSVTLPRRQPGPPTRTEKSWQNSAKRRALSAQRTNAPGCEAYFRIRSAGC